MSHCEGRKPPGVSVDRRRVLRAAAHLAGGVTLGALRTATELRALLSV